MSPFIYVLFGLSIIFSILGILSKFWKIDGRKTPVSQWTKDDDFIDNFSSVKEASISTNTSYNGIIKCCQGLQKTSGGFCWKYGKYEIK